MSSEFLSVHTRQQDRDEGALRTSSRVFHLEAAHLGLAHQLKGGLEHEANGDAFNTGVQGRLGVRQSAERARGREE